MIYPKWHVSKFLKHNVQSHKNDHLLWMTYRVWRTMTSFDFSAVNFSMFCIPTDIPTKRSGSLRYSFDHTYSSTKFEEPANTFGVFEEGVDTKYFKLRKTIFGFFVKQIWDLNQALESWEGRWLCSSTLLERVNYCCAAYPNFYCRCL